MTNKYLILTLIILSFSCKTEDVEPITPITPVVTPPSSEIYGCTDQNAVNYNIDATFDDGCCKYESLILNEILYDPPGDITGDANGDGVRHFDDDEFIELVNVSNQNVDISGYKFYDQENFVLGIANHVVPSNTIIEPNKAYVVFGGGTPTGSFGGATFHVASSAAFNLNTPPNSSGVGSGDTLTINDANGINVILFPIRSPLSGNPDESYTLSPDICGDLVQHAVANSSLLFSPGTKIDGSPF